MSATYTQWCQTHGEWDMDIDNPSECPECIKLGLTEVQQLRQTKLDLETELAGCQQTIKLLQAALATPQPGKEQNLYFQLQDAKASIRALTNRLAQREVSYEISWKTWCIKEDKLNVQLANLKESFAKLREDRDQILSEYNKLRGSH